MGKSCGHQLLRPQSKHGVAPLRRYSCDDTWREHDYRRDSAPNEELLEAALKDLADITKATTVLWAINHTITDVSYGDEMRVVSGEGVIHEVNGVKYRYLTKRIFSKRTRTRHRTCSTLCASLRATLPTKHSSTCTAAGQASLRSLWHRVQSVLLVWRWFPTQSIDAQKNAAINNVNAEFHDARQKRSTGKRLARTSSFGPTTRRHGRQSARGRYCRKAGTHRLRQLQL